jgi:hypothetical protein
MQKYPDQFVMSTDSGYGLDSEEIAIEAMYRLIDALDDIELARKIAYDNMYGMIKDQPATTQQLESIRRLDEASGTKRDITGMTKLEAGKLLIKGDRKS